MIEIMGSYLVYTGTPLGAVLAGLIILGVIMYFTGD